jgi:myo-inositol-1(or 4)-monophosphatase
LTREDFKVWYKGDGDDDPVTEIDLQLDRYLKHRLLERWPDYGWLSEESSDDRRRLGKRRTWIVDPLDGTRQLVAGIPEYASSIALEEGGKIIASAVLMLASGDRYTAARGDGAYLNGRRLSLRDELKLGQDRVLVSRREAEDGRFDALSGPDDAFVLRPLGGMANKLARVADG